MYVIITCRVKKLFAKNGQCLCFYSAVCHRNHALVLTENPMTF